MDYIFNVKRIVCKKVSLESAPSAKMRIECECSRPVGNKFPSCSLAQHAANGAERARESESVSSVGGGVCVRGSKSDYARKDRQPAAQDPAHPGSQYFTHFATLQVGAGVARARERALLFLNKK